MPALAALLALALSFQDDARLREAWPKLQECWKALDAAKPEPTGRLTDDLLKALGRLDAAVEAAGLRDGNASFVSGALRHLLIQRGQRLLPAPSTGNVAWLVAGGGGAMRRETPRNRRAAVDGLLSGIRKLRDLASKGLDDEDNVQDQLTEIRKAMKDAGVVSDETPMWLRRRALTLIRALDAGQPFPETPAPTAEEAARLQKLIVDLGSEDPVVRDQATRELSKSGEQAQDLLAGAVKGADPEVAARAKTILGMGHEPWKVEAATPEAPGVRQVIEFKALETGPLFEEPADR